MPTKWRFHWVARKKRSTGSTGRNWWVSTIPNFHITKIKYRILPGSVPNSEKWLKVSHECICLLQSVVVTMNMTVRIPVNGLCVICICRVLLIFVEDTQQRAYKNLLSWQACWRWGTGKQDDPKQHRKALGKTPSDTKGSFKNNIVTMHNLQENHFMMPYLDKLSLNSCEFLLDFRKFFNLCN